MTASFQPEPNAPQEGQAGCPSGLAPADASPAADPAAFVRERAGGQELDLLVRGAKCAGCMSRIETAVSALPGVSVARLNLSSGRLHVEWSGKALKARQIAAAVTGLGYGASAYDPGEAVADRRREERGLLLAMAVAGFASANVMMLSAGIWAGDLDMDASTRTLLQWFSAAVALPAAAFAGQPFFRSAWRALSARQVNMDVPISLAVILASAMSVYETVRQGQHTYFDAVVSLLFLLLVGRYLDARLKRKAYAAAHNLAAMQAASVTRISASGDASSVRASEVRPGDLLLLSPGERLAVDGVVVRGSSEIDASMVSGETRPLLVGDGARIHAGSINLSAPLRIRASAAAEDSLMADIARMLEAGEQKKSRYRQIADRAAELYVPIVHTLAAAAFAGWLVAGAGLREAAFTAIAVLIITCPCALGLAAPVVQVVASGRLFRAGLFLRSGDALERLAQVRHVVFDKTGTLTLGAPRWIRDAASDAVLDGAAQLARASRHPYSRAIVEAAGPGRVAEDVRELPGQGVSGLVAGRPARLGSAAWLGAGQHQAASSLWFAFEGEPPVPFQFEDAIRPGARETIAALEARGVTVEILSGDRSAAVEDIARRLGVTTWTAGVDPAGKAARLAEIEAAGSPTLMVGDGLNDAGALAQAHASMAPGGAMDVSRSASDIVFGGDSLEAVVLALDVSRSARLRMLENFWLSAAYNVIAVPLALAGLATPLVAAVAMSVSSMVVTLNALRLTVRKREGRNP